MSGVIRGIGAVCWPAWRCQSLSASISAPRSARARKTPWPSGHELTAPSPSDELMARVSISAPHRGQVKVSMPRRYRPGGECVADAAPVRRYCLS